MAIYLGYDFWFVFLIILLITKSEKVSIFFSCRQEKVCSRDTCYSAILLAWLFFLHFPKENAYIALMLYMIVLLAVKLDQYLFYVFILFLCISGVIGFYLAGIVADHILVLIKSVIYLVLICGWILMIKNNLTRGNCLL